MKLTAVFEKVPEGYIAFVEELPGANAQGKTLDEARRNLTEAVVTSPKLTLLIDAAGRPVKGTAEIDGRGRVSGQLQEIVIDLTVTFVKLGQPVTIKAP